MKTSVLEQGEIAPEKTVYSLLRTELHGDVETGRKQHVLGMRGLAEQHDDGIIRGIYCTGQRKCAYIYTERIQLPCALVKGSFWGGKTYCKRFHQV